MHPLRLFASRTAASSCTLLILAASAVHTGCGDSSDDPGGALDNVSPTPVEPYGVTGALTTVQEAAVGADCTIFHPTDLTVGGKPFPVIIWGNGTFSSVSYYQDGLTHLASHGFIVAAANTSNAGHGTEMAACLDWLSSENSRVGSPYAGHVDLDHVGASGHSQGGGGTIMLGRDPRIKATAPLEPYVQTLFGHDPASASQQHGPMLLFSGSEDTIAASDANQQPVFDTSNVPTFWGTLIGADHVQSATVNFTGFRAPMTAWFRLHLAGDEAARSIFYGNNCTLCTDSTWKVQKKDID